jgi:ABC-2 type transport system permease protein
MLKLKAYIKKEFLTLLRDRGGLAVLFFMPVILIIIMSLIQDAPFREYQELKIPILVLDLDKDSLSKDIIRGLASSKIFKIDSNIEGKSLTEADLLDAVNHGTYQLGICIPKGSSQALRERVSLKVNETLSAFGLNENKDSTLLKKPTIDFKVYIDPAAKKSFRSSVLSSMEKFVLDIQLKEFIRAFGKSLGSISPQQTKLNFDTESGIRFQEIVATTNKNLPDFTTNSVQHNVPAWTLFAMFFIVIPMAGNMIKERDLGSEMRLLVLPGSINIPIFGRIITYSLVCQIQLWIMLAVGIWILPLLGLPKLQIGQVFFPIVLAGLLSSLSATAFGVMVGTVFKTLQQAMVFGSVSVVILSALGGIWIPTYVMPESIQTISSLSPLNWGLESFNNIFLRGINKTSSLPWLQTGCFVLVCFGFIRIAKRN